jgi:hypothetical protein
MLLKGDRVKLTKSRKYLTEKGILVGAEGELIFNSPFPTDLSKMGRFGYEENIENASKMHNIKFDCCKELVHCLDSEIIFIGEPKPDKLKTLEDHMTRVHNRIKK